MDSKYPKSTSVSLGGQSFEGAVDQLSQAFGKFDGSPRKAAFKFRWSTDLTSHCGLSLVSGCYSGEWDLWPVDETPEMLSVVRCRTGGLQTFLGKKTVEGRAGSLILANNLEAGRCALRGDTHACDALFIDWKIISRVARDTFDRPFQGSLELLSEVDISTSERQWLATLVDTICDGMRPGGPLLQSPLAAARMAEALANIILLRVPNRVTPLLDRTPPSIAPRSVKQAIDFMWEHIAEPITVQVVADAIGVSPRSLEMGFRSFKGTTPAAYLRDIRLEAAHEELSNPLSTLSIKEVCLKWGFFHFGRFSKLYSEIYGLMPSETKARARSR